MPALARAFEQVAALIKPGDEEDHDHECSQSEASHSSACRHRARKKPPNANAVQPPSNKALQLTAYSAVIKSAVW